VGDGRPPRLDPHHLNLFFSFPRFEAPPACHLLVKQILRAFGPQDDSSPLLIWEKRRKEKDVQWARGLTAPLWALARA